MDKHFSKPKISKGPKEWYLQYSYRHPLTGKMHRFKERFDMNRIKDMRERNAYAAECVAFMTEQLKAGFNPFSQVKVTDLKRLVLTQVQDIIRELTVSGSNTTRESYQRVYNSFEKWINEAGYQESGLHLFTVNECREYQNWLRMRKLAGKTINGLVSHLGLFWDHAISRGQCEENPWRKLKPVKRQAAKEDKFEPITHDEMKAIWEGLRRKGEYNFLAFLGLIYYAYARPVEIARLKVSDIDLQRNLITFRQSATKNMKGANVQIVEPLRKMLMGLKLHQYPGDHYIFSTLDLHPGPHMRPMIMLWKRWQKLVQQGMGIKKQMYALKHTGNIDYLINNKGKVDLKWQQMQNRHSSATMTEKYCRKLGAYFVDTGQISFTEF